MEGYANAGREMAATSLGRPSAEPIRVPQVNESINRLAENIAVATKQAENMEQRLCNVLRPCPPSTGKDGTNKVREAKATLAEQIDNLADRVQYLNDQLTQLQARIEV